MVGTARRGTVVAGRTRWANSSLSPAGRTVVACVRRPASPHPGNPLPPGGSRTAPTTGRGGGWAHRRCALGPVGEAMPLGAPAPSTPRDTLPKGWKRSLGRRADAPHPRPASPSLVGAVREPPGAGWVAGVRCGGASPTRNAAWAGWGPVYGSGPVVGVRDGRDGEEGNRRRRTYAMGEQQPVARRTNGRCVCATPRVPSPRQPPPPGRFANRPYNRQRGRVGASAMRLGPSRRGDASRGALSLHTPGHLAQGLEGGRWGVAADAPHPRPVPGLVGAVREPPGAGWVAGVRCGGASPTRNAAWAGWGPVYGSGPVVGVRDGRDGEEGNRRRRTYAMGEQQLVARRTNGRCVCATPRVPSPRQPPPPGRFANRPYNRQRGRVGASAMRLGPVARRCL